jgi:hypothetical protein
MTITPTYEMNAFFLGGIITYTFILHSALNALHTVFGPIPARRLPYEASIEVIKPA